MKEYWVNAYESGYIGRKFDFKPHWNKDSVFGRIVYRIHVKMKDKIGLSRNYYWTFDEWKFFNGSQWTPEQMKELKQIGRQIPVKLKVSSKTYDWMDVT